MQIVDDAENRPKKESKSSHDRIFRDFPMSVVPLKQILKFYLRA
jgi:hypothetical protein